jgi:predicted DNA-binding transcriptional regulator AlpA
MTKPFKPITREEAADILKISLSTLDNMIASGAIPVPVSINGSRRKYWHPDILYSWLDRELRRDTSKTDVPPETHSRDTPRKPPGRKATPPMGIADRARIRNAARIAQLNVDGE